MSDHRSSGTPTRITVLQSLPQVRSTTNPYLVQLLTAMPPSVRVRTFSWRTALAGRYDVLHVHWPENLARGAGRARTVLRQLAFSLVLLRLALTRTPLVRTLHNTEPHERGPLAERLLLRWCDRLTTVWVRLNPFSVPPRPGPVETIVHGHYRDWYEHHEVPASVPGRLVFFGLIRPYKGVEDLVAAVQASGDASLSLHVVGKPATPEMAHLVESASAIDPRIRPELGYAPDDVLAREVGEAELVVLPYRDLHNSGSLLLALSLGRPVMVPDNDITRALAAEVGEDWVLTYEGTVDAARLDAGLRAVRGSTAARTSPDLGRRSWEQIGAAHERAYRAALEARRGRRAGGRVRSQPRLYSE